MCWSADILRSFSWADVCFELREFTKYHNMDLHDVKDLTVVEL